jgi:hypothetical protein
MPPASDSRVEVCPKSAEMRLIDINIDADIDISV